MDSELQSKTREHANRLLLQAKLNLPNSITSL